MNPDERCKIHDIQRKRLKEDGIFSKQRKQNFEHHDCIYDIAETREISGY